MPTGTTQSRHKIKPTRQPGYLLRVTNEIWGKEPGTPRGARRISLLQAAAQNLHETTEAMDTLLPLLRATITAEQPSPLGRGVQDALAILQLWDSALTQTVSDAEQIRDFLDNVQVEEERGAWLRRKEADA